MSDQQLVALALACLFERAHDPVEAALRTLDVACWAEEATQVARNSHRRITRRIEADLNGPRKP